MCSRQEQCSFDLPILRFMSSVESLFVSLLGACQCLQDVVSFADSIGYLYALCVKKMYLNTLLVTLDCGRGEVLSHQS